MAADDDDDGVVADDDEAAVAAAHGPWMIAAEWPFAAVPSTVPCAADCGDDRVHDDAADCCR